MIKVLVLRVERVVYLERAAGFRQIAGDLNIAVEFSRQPVGRGNNPWTSERFDPVAAAMAGPLSTSAKS